MAVAVTTIVLAVVFMGLYIIARRQAKKHSLRARRRQVVERYRERLGGGGKAPADDNKRE